MKLKYDLDALGISRHEFMFKLTPLHEASSHWKKPEKLPEPNTTGFLAALYPATRLDKMGALLCANVW